MTQRTTESTEVVRIAVEVRCHPFPGNGKPRTLHLSDCQEFRGRIEFADYFALNDSGSKQDNWIIDAIVDASPYLRGNQKINGSGARLARQLQLLVFCILLCLRYDLVITSQIPTLTLPMTLAKRLIFWRKTRLVVREFILWCRNCGVPPNALKRSAAKFVANTLDLAVCCSSREPEYYCRVLRVDPVKATFLHVSSDRPYLRSRESHKPRFILACGRTGRDYATFLEAVRNSGVVAVLVCSARNVEGLRIPPNVEVKYDIPGPELESLIETSAFLVVPLSRSLCSAGQRIIEAGMASGKAVVATRTTGSIDYIDHCQNGILVDPGDSEGLRKEILNLWKTPSLAARLGEEAATFARHNFAAQTYADHFIPLLHTLTK